jgi:hypothetical protein
VFLPFDVLFPLSLFLRDSAESYRAIQGSGQIHWFSIINSVLIIFVLSSLVAIILAKTLRKDFISYALVRFVSFHLSVFFSLSRRSASYFCVSSSMALAWFLLRSIEEEEGEKLEDETGWKLLHADVFRAPHCPGTLGIRRFLLSFFLFLSFFFSFSSSFFLFYFSLSLRRVADV